MAAEDEAPRQETAPATEDPAPVNAPRQTSWAGRIAHHPLFVVVVGAATIVAGGAALIELWPQAEQATTTASPGTAVDQPPEVFPGTPSSSAAPDPPSPAADPAVGLCVLTGAIPSAGSCDAAHTFEIFSLDDCSEPSLVRYLGGQSPVDRVRVVPTTLEVSGREVCVVGHPTGQPTATRARDVLQGPAHSAWRTCLDKRTDVEVACSEEHTGEIAVPDVAASPLDCEATAGAYMQARVTDLSENLLVAAVQSVDGPRCLIEVRGADLLNGSVRNLGSASLPLVQN